MTDTSVITILANEGNRIDFRVRTTSAGGPDDLSCTRSFALALLETGRRNSGDYYNGGSDYRLNREGGIGTEVNGWPESWYIDEDWMTENVARYIERTEILARRNVFGGRDQDWQKLTGGLHALLDQSRQFFSPEGEALSLEVSHSLDLRVWCTDAKWLEGFEAGRVFGAADIDAWWEDPLRPEIPEGTPAPNAGERWRVYANEGRYWAIRLIGNEQTERSGAHGTLGEPVITAHPTRAAAVASVLEHIERMQREGFAFVSDEGQDDDTSDL